VTAAELAEREVEMPCRAWAWLKEALGFKPKPAVAAV